MVRLRARLELVKHPWDKDYKQFIWVVITVLKVSVGG